MWAEAKAMTRISEVSNEAHSGNAPSGNSYKVTEERERQQVTSWQAPVAPVCVKVSTEKMRRAVSVNGGCGRRRRRCTTSSASRSHHDGTPLVSGKWRAAIRRQENKRPRTPSTHTREAGGRREKTVREQAKVLFLYTHPGRSPTWLSRDQQEDAQTQGQVANKGAEGERRLPTALIGAFVMFSKNSSC